MRLTLQFFAYGSLTDTTSSANTNDGESPGHRCCGGWRGLLALAWRHQRFDIRCPSACESVVIGAVLFIGCLTTSSCALRPRAQKVTFVSCCGKSNVVPWIFTQVPKGNR